MMRTIAFGTALLWLSLNSNLHAAEQKPAPPAEQKSDAESAWKELEKLTPQVTPPAEWQRTPPAEAEIDKFKASESDRLAKAAAQAKDFQTRFPSSPHLSDAASKEYELLQSA